ncbi:MAG TPA: DUF5060 domain-containing protein [Bryobacteraceae bacterium]|nr:DUF5060 domain-containing protein [Bryobacteraceae bacterium]
MGLKSAVTLLALTPLALQGQAPAAAAAAPCSNTPAYAPCELVLELSEKDAAAHPNPYVTIDVKVEFRSPRNRTLSVPMYWDGGRRMVARFAPTEAGDWIYHVSGNVSAWADKEGTFTAVASESKGFIRPANMHHWAYTVRDSRGLDQAHLWMGATELLFPSLDDAAFQSVADARAAQKFTHLRGLVLSQEQASAFQSPEAPNLQYFQRLDQRIRYLNDKGIIADLVLAGGPGYLTKVFPTAQQRNRFVRFLVGRYSAMNVTWQTVDAFEDYPDTRALLKDLGSQLKLLDFYNHPRSAGAHLTSSPLLTDGWMSYAACGTPDDNLGAVEHQLFDVPFVNLSFGREDSGAGKKGPDDVDAAEFRRRLWNSTMDGQYPTYANTGAGAQYANSPGAKAMTAWFDLMSDARHWELEPYFDVDGGRAVALEDTEYIVYVEKPGPVELSVEKHSYEVFWMNPADGEITKDKKKFSGEHFTGEPPNRSHDWVLHLVREGHLESMNKSFKFESRDIVLQEVEANTPKVPFVVEAPTGDLSISKPTPYSAKLTRESRATRVMRWLWMGEVATDHQGYKVLATSQKGMMQPPHSIATNYPALMHLRVYGMNANGKVYEVDSAFTVNP